MSIKLRQVLEDAHNAITFLAHVRHDRVHSLLDAAVWQLMPSINAMFIKRTNYNETKIREVQIRKTTR